MRDGWVESTLDEIADFINGYPFKPTDLGDIGTPVIRIKQLLDPTEPVDRTEIETPERCLLEDGDIVFSWSGTLAVRIWNRGPAKLNQHLFKVVEKEGVFKGIVPLILDRAIEELEQKSHGTTMKHITKQTLLPHKVLLPPLPDQRRIVDLISSVDFYIESLQQKFESEKRSRNAVLHELLSAGGDDWVETTLGEVSEVIGGGTPSTSIPEYWEGEIVWLTPSEITSQHGEFVSNSIRKISELGLKNSGAQMLPKGSVILTSRASVGYVAISAIELCTNQGFQSLVPKDSVLAEFLMFWIQQNRSEFESRSAGSTFKEISKSNVKSIKLSLPPLPEQRRIIEIISTIDGVKGKTEIAIKEAKRLRSGLLSDLLSGAHEIPSSYDKVMGVA
jgi:type I restriction enzyme S subunit